LKFNSITKAYWALVAISFFWGTTWFVSKLTVPHIPALQLTGMRQLIAGIIVITFFISKTKKLPTPRALLFHLICGFLLISCSNGLTTFAIKVIPSFLGALISCLTPFVFVLFNYTFNKQKVNSKVVMGLVIGFGGIATLLSSFATEMNHPDFKIGIILSLIAVFTWTSGTLISVKNKFNINPYEGIGWQMLLGGIILLSTSWLTGQHVPLNTIPINAWLYFIYLTGIGSLFCFMCYLYALQQLPLGLVSIYVYINPIIALTLGIIVLNEKINATILIGSFITIFGIYVVKKFSPAKN
jgi:drug/metabolite transporter (DMT)-like permease